MSRFTNITPDLRVYATVFYSDHSLQYRCTVCMCALSTPISFLMFYLIWTQSRHERFSIKLWTFFYHLSFYCGELQLGVFGGMVTLYPFPAGYSQGLLKDCLDTFTLFMIWAFTFCSFALVTFILQLTRLQVVARPGKFFDRQKSTYYTIYAILALFLYIPVPSAMYCNYSTPEEMEEFVRWKYPNNLQILEHHGFFMFIDSEMQNIAYTTMIASVVLIFSLLSFIYISIYLETRGSAQRQSYRNLKERLKGLQNFVVQSIIMCGFMATSTFLIFKTIFNDPETDSRIQNAIAYSFLCGATIPVQILTIWRNSAYREFVMGRKKSVAVIPEVSIHIQRRSVMGNS